MNIWIVGDSNAYGYRTGGGRLPAAARWPDILKKERPSDKITLEGMNGRLFDGTPLGMAAPFDGRPVIEEGLRQHAPEVLIVQLGANDLSAGIGVALLAENMAEAFRRWQAHCNILVILPHAEDPVEGIGFGPDWLSRATVAFDKALRAEAPLGISFVDTINCPVDPWDGLHLAPAGHRLLAEKVNAALNEM